MKAASFPPSLPGMASLSPQAGLALLGGQELTLGQLALAACSVSSAWRCSSAV